jgi:hypothetical protein
MKVLAPAGFLLGLLLLQARSADFLISSADHQGHLAWSNALPTGVCTAEVTPLLTNSVVGQWVPLQNFYTTNPAGQGTLASIPSNQLVRLRAVDVSTNTPAGYTNLIQSYGRIQTIAGSGNGSVDNVNYWQPGFEGAFATNVALSRPHIAVCDPAGNIFIADKNSHSILKVTPDGRLHTVAGTHLAGNGPDSLTSATHVALNQPNGLWLRADQMLYVLDLGNSKIRRLDTNGFMATLMTMTNGTMSVGRGIWVSDDESLAYFASGADMEKWTPSGGVQTLNNNFKELGNFILDPHGDIIATDRGANKVYLLDATGSGAGSRSVMFGNGGTNQVVEGTLAKTNSLYGVRAVWALPTGGYFLGTHEGSQVLYVDPAGIIHVFVNGAIGAHAGDGQWFYTPGYKVSEPRAVTLDPQGNLLITESDSGYVRRVEFMRLSP